MIKTFHANNYTGENMIIVGTGNIDENKLFSLSE